MRPDRSLESRAIARRLTASRLAILAGLLLALAAAAAVLAASSSSTQDPAAQLAGNPVLDPGSPLDGRPAPDFRLTDQFGHRVRLSSYRGKVVLLDFNDSHCTTICPLTTTVMVDARRLLGRAGSDVALLGVNANPDATSIHDVLSYSELHGMTHLWRFGTGSRAQLKAVWRAYRILDEVSRGQIDHTPALFVIDPRGRMQHLYITQQSYAAVGQLAQLVAGEISRLLPGHPPVASHLSYVHVPGTSRTARTELPRFGGGTVAVGPTDARARLYVFFATWDREVGPLRRWLESLNRYVAASAGLPPLTAVDEGSVEPSARALGSFLGTVRPLAYPVAIDTTGRLADGYEVQDQPWFVLVGARGQILWFRDAGVDGWPAPGALAAQVRAALSRAPEAGSSKAAAQRALAGSPPPLAALHSHGGALLRGSLGEALRSLRGYPVVVNVWASSCAPCKAEFGLLESAATSFGRRVAFLGADYDDSAGDAQAFLRGHWVPYPSYAVGNGELDRYLPGGVAATPTTFYIGPAGRVRYVHTGQYSTQGSLDGDVQSYALGAG